jgi:uncharacterized protein
VTREVFLDTSYLVASINPRDTLHEKAGAVMASLARVRFVTTDAVLAEFLGYYSGWSALRTTAVASVDELRDAAHCRIFHFGRNGFEAALRRYRARPDKGYSLVDCHSMLVMEERRIKEVLTSDDHFRQAGFTCLLPTGGRVR